MSIQVFSDFRFRLGRITLSPTNLVSCTLAFMLFAFAAIFISSYHRIERQRSMVEQLVGDRARHTSGAFDDWVRSQLQMLTVLGTSAVLQADRPANVRLVADAALRGTRAWESISIFDGETGITIAETGSPLVTGVRKAVCPDLIARAISGEPVICTSSKEPIDAADLHVVVAIAVGRDSRNPIVVSAVIALARLQEQLQQQGTPMPGIIESLVSETKVILARYPEPSLYVGRRPTTSYSDQLGGRSSGTFVAKSLDGRDVLVAVYRSPITGWIRNVAMALEDIPQARDEEFWGTLRLMFASVMFLLLALCLFSLRRQVASAREDRG